jgi:hypothetical protein
MSQTVRNKLETLRDKTDADSLSEVIRRALALYECLWKERQNGAKVIIRSPDADKELVFY